MKSSKDPDFQTVFDLNEMNQMALGKSLTESMALSGIREASPVAVRQRFLEEVLVLFEAKAGDLEACRYTKRQSQAYRIEWNVNLIIAPSNSVDCL